MRIGIVGYGVVGKALARFLKRSHEIFTYDKFLAGHDTAWDKSNVRGCDLVFISVPTPTTAEGVCDISAVQEVVDWLDAPLCVKSTVIPGTVERLSALSGKQIVFSPEYIGESPGHPWPEIDSCGFLIVGGPSGVARLVVNAYRLCSPEIACYETESRTAELCKYMENCFLATKVVFVNQFHDIAAALNVPFDELRRLWLLDTRIGASHTVVTGERGFGGRCLPKDMTALISALVSLGGAEFLEYVLRYNTTLRSDADSPLQIAERVVY